MSNVTECYKAPEGAVPKPDNSPFSELILGIAFYCLTADANEEGYQQGLKDAAWERDEY